MNNKKISIIEDDSTIRESLTLYLEAKTSFEIVSEHDRVETFLTKGAHISPDMLLLDIGLPGMTGIEGIPRIKALHPNVDIIILTTYEEDKVIFEALCAGACSYLSKRTSLEKIIEAVKIVANGGSYMSPSIAKKVTKFFLQKPVKAEATLTDRQKEIVQFIVDGKSYRQIAETCEITINTVKTHIKRIYIMLEINSKVGLIQKFNDGEI